MIPEVMTVIDVGPGLRPQKLVRASHHICIEPYQKYADELVKAGFEVIRGKAPEAINGLKADVVVALDVIEHMEKDEGRTFIEYSKRVSKRVLIFTPNGFQQQDDDSWGMGGDYWQTHRSGWIPEEFHNWKIICHKGSFFALWRKL